MADYGPNNPNFGMEGPDFHCSSCQYLLAGNKCGHEDFAKYMKTEAPATIPAQAARYCCNAYRPADPSAYKLESKLVQIHWVSKSSLS